MSLTSKIKTESAREYQASDGTIYLLQRAINVNSLIASEGLLPDLLRETEQSNSAERTEQILMQNPQLLERMMRVSEKHMPKALRDGLIGEVVIVGGDRRILYYTMVDKPAAMLQEGEINPALIPDDLAQELFNQITKIGVPEVTPAALKTFPVQPVSAANLGDGEAMRQIAERGDLGG